MPGGSSSDSVFLAGAPAPACLSVSQSGGVAAGGWAGEASAGPHLGSQADQEQEEEAERALVALTSASSVQDPGEQRATALWDGVQLREISGTPWHRFCAGAATSASQSTVASAGVGCPGCAFCVWAPGLSDSCCPSTSFPCPRPLLPQPWLRPPGPAAWRGLSVRTRLGRTHSSSLPPSFPVCACLPAV